MLWSDIKLVVFYLWGFSVVLLHAVLVSVMAIWALQFAAAMFGETFAWSVIFQHLILSTYFLMLFPGQTLWIVRLTGPGGVVYTIVGETPANSEA